MNIRPTEDRILIEPAEPESITPGGIVLPENAKERPQKGTVLAVGPGRFIEGGILIEPRIMVGSEVLFTKYGGIEIDGLIIMRENEILAIIT